MSKQRSESITELNIYRKARKLLGDFMPEIYFMQADVLEDDVWVAMELVEKLENQTVFIPQHFDQIIPQLAAMHAQTYYFRFHEHLPIFRDWLPIYQSETMIKERNMLNTKTRAYLTTAMNRHDLHAKISPHYNRMQAILAQGPNYFPELIEAGESIVHSDLQAINIGCNNVRDSHWKIKFIDWEGARFEPCWYDLVSLVGVFLFYRNDLRKQENAIIHHCSHLYATEMQKHGIVFRIDAVKLYKMAVLQLILQKYLYLQLHWEIEGLKKGVLLSSFIEKINSYGEEMGLF